MKKLMMIAAMMCIASITAFAQPKLVIEGGDTHDWGTVKQPKDPLKATVVIRNDGTDTLKISDVKPGCGCTSAPLDKKVLMPGEQTNMNVTLNVGTSSGNVHKTIRISSNDPINKDRILSLKAFIFTTFTVTPSYFNYLNAQVGIESISTVKIKNNTQNVINIKAIETNPVSMVTNIANKKTIQPGEEFEVVSRVTPNKTGGINTSLKIVTDNPDMPTISISGWGQVKESPVLNNIEAR